VIFGCEADEIGDRLRTRIENRVQKALVDRKKAARGGLQEAIGRNAFVASRLED
jgi:hypothetical protein